MPIVTNGWMDQDDIWYGGLGPGNLVLDGNPAHSSHTPEFSAHVCCGQTAGWIRMPLRMEVGLGQGHIVLDGDPVPEKWGYSAPGHHIVLGGDPALPPSPTPKKGGGHRAPCKFSTHVCCGQTAGWIKMLLGTEVSHGPGDIVLDGNLCLPTEKGIAAPRISAHVYCGQTVTHLSKSYNVYNVIKLRQSLLNTLMLLTCYGQICCASPSSLVSISLLAAIYSK